MSGQQVSSRSCCVVIVTCIPQHHIAKPNPSHYVMLLYISSSYPFDTSIPSTHLCTDFKSTGCYLVSLYIPDQTDTRVTKTLLANIASQLQTVYVVDSECSVVCLARCDLTAWRRPGLLVKPMFVT